jgi:hypothetical protein
MPVILPHGIVGCIEHAVAVDIAAGWINRQDARYFPPIVLERLKLF